MQHNDDIRWQAFERAVSRLEELGGKIHQQLKSVIETPDGVSRLTMRDLAYLEGLRSDRDAALDELRRLELELFNALMSRLGSITDSLK